MVFLVWMEGCDGDVAYIYGNGNKMVNTVVGWKTINSMRKKVGMRLNSLRHEKIKF